MLMFISSLLFMMIAVFRGCKLSSLKTFSKIYQRTYPQIGMRNVARATWERANI